MIVQEEVRMLFDSLYIVQVVIAEGEFNGFGLPVKGYYLEVLCCSHFTRGWLFAECDPDKLEIPIGYWDMELLASLPTEAVQNPL